jgi:hypothetical protein
MTTKLEEIEIGERLSLGDIAVVTPYPNNREFIIFGKLDGQVSIWNMEDNNIVCELSESLNSVYAIAVESEGAEFCTAGKDMIIYRYKFVEDGCAAFQNFVKRLHATIRALSYHPSGHIIASGTDSGDIYVVEVNNEDMFTIIKYHIPVVSLAYDPLGKLLGSVYKDGTIIVWDAVSGEAKFTSNWSIPHPKQTASLENINYNIYKICWNSNGKNLFCPGTNGVINVFSRSELMSIDRGNIFEGNCNLEGDVGPIAISPYGDYLAVADQLGNIVIYCVINKKDVSAMKVGGSILSLTWCLGINTHDLLIYQDCGKLVIWRNCITKKAIDIRENSEISSSKNPSVVQVSIGQKINFNNLETAIICLMKPSKPQSAIQPGSTPIDPTKTCRFLAYNLNGYICSKLDGSNTTIEIFFHDLIEFPNKLSLFIDINRINIGALGVIGAFFACPPKKSKLENYSLKQSNINDPSNKNHFGRLMFRSYESWKKKSDWEVLLELGEEAKCLAMGQCFAAAVTDRKLLHIFSLTGVHLTVRMLPGKQKSLAKNHLYHLKLSIFNLAYFSL